jgi:hypothetical protein
VSPDVFQSLSTLRPEGYSVRGELRPVSASLIRVNARRVLLWSAIVVEFLLILVLHFRAGAVHLLTLGSR